MGEEAFQTGRGGFIFLYFPLFLRVPVIFEPEIVYGLYGAATWRKGAG
jgi:hypothetical protein